MHPGDCIQNVSVNFDYDYGINGIGRRTSMTDDSGSSAWTYDTRGRVSLESKVFTGAGTYNTSWTYNAADLPVTMTYPDGEVVTYNYNDRMLLNSLSGANTYVSSTNYDPAGRITTRALGNSLTQTYNYYAWNETATVDGQPTGQGGRLKQMTVGTLQNLSYVYDAVGNIRQITNAIASETNSYSYDTLDRLTGWTLNAQSESYTYNVTTGNLASKAGMSLQYNDSAHVHAVTNAGGNTYSHDANGSQTTRVVGGKTYDLDYDAENRLVSVSTGGMGMNLPLPLGDAKRPVRVSWGEVSQGHFASYNTGPLLQGGATATPTPKPSKTPTPAVTQTPSNTPAATSTPSNTPAATNTPTATAAVTATNTPKSSNTPSPTVTPTSPPQATFSNATFTYNGDGRRVKSVITTNQGTTTTYFASPYYEVSNGVVIKYYMAGAQRVAMRTNGTLNYLLADHLGSTSVTTNASGGLVSELRYKPWGEERYASGSTPTQYRYTSQFSHELDFGLYFYQARWYDPALGRFNQPDSIVPEQSQGTQAWDRYGYVNNNPVLYNDPSGHCAVVCVFGIAMAVGALIGGGINAYTQYQNTGQIDVAEVMGAAAGGALIGGGVVLAAAAATAVLPVAVSAAPVACADGDCTNEALAVGNMVTQAVSADGDPTNEVITVAQTASSTTSAITTYYPPNNGFVQQPQLQTVLRGDILERLGDPRGSFLSPAGTPLSQRSVPFGAENLPSHTYEALQSFDVWAGKAAPWFGKVGYGIQYWLGRNRTVQQLLDSKYLKELDK